MLMEEFFPRWSYFRLRISYYSASYEREKDNHYHMLTVQQRLGLLNSTSLHMRLVLYLPIKSNS